MMCAASSMPCNVDVGGSKEMSKYAIGLNEDHDITLNEVTRESKKMSVLFCATLIS